MTTQKVYQVYEVVQMKQGKPAMNPIGPEHKTQREAKQWIEVNRPFDVMNNITHVIMEIEHP